MAAKQKAQKQKANVAKPSPSKEAPSVPWSDFIGTIEDDDETPILDGSEDEEDEQIVPVTKKKKGKKNAPVVSVAEDRSGLNPQFRFDVESGVEQSWDFSMAKSFAVNSHRLGTSVNEKIKQHLLQPATAKAGKRKREDDDEDDDDEDEENDEDEDDEGDNEEEEDDDDDNEQDDDDDDDDGDLDDEEAPDVGVRERNKSRQQAAAAAAAAQATNDDAEDEDAEDDEETKARKNAFFGSIPDGISSAETFLTMNLSRPIMRALTQLGFDKPTPIQSQTIPLAMQGLDICASAVTGSGKTAAFVIPILERLLFRARGVAASRVLIMTPTRELAVQCHSVATKLARFTDIHFALLVGGLSNKAQEAVLRQRPDVLIATPGRLIDHIRNAPSFDLNALEILVMDEADRMLEDGFKEELTEIIRYCPRGRQTMLFSASMTDDVDNLISLSLNSPVRIFVDKSNQLASNLVQEFVRLRSDQDREAIVAALCKRTFHSQCIVFISSKKATHRMKIIFGLLGLNAAELHGDLNQKDRLEALELFRDGKVDFLLATDVAARGLDIVGIKTVINMQMPLNFKSYLHRVGRTARAGREGRSVTLVGENERKNLKMAIKHAKDAVKKRVVSPEIINKFRDRINQLQTQIDSIAQQEKTEKEMGKAQMELNKAENMIKYEKEIASRPARTWFQSTAEKNAAKDPEPAKSTTTPAKKNNIKRSKTDGMSRAKKRRFLSREEDAKELQKAKSAVHSAKAQAKPKRISKEPAAKTAKGKASPSPKKSKTGSFANELANTTKKALQELRSSGKKMDGKPKDNKSRGSSSSSNKKREHDNKSEKKPLGKLRSKKQFKSQKRFKRR